MSVPTDRRYSESHEWHKTEGGLVVLGITRFAVEQLTDITFVQMKPKGTRVKAGDIVGEVESVKTTSDIYSGIAGEVVEVNAGLAASPGLVNEDPFGTGWLVKLRPENPAAVESLLDAAAYEKLHG